MLKFVPLAVIGLIGLFFIDGGNYEPFAPEGTWTAISAAAPLTLWAFIGLESATVPAEEVRDPERTIPRATMLGTVITTVLYIVATVAIMGILPTAQLAGSTSPFADAAAPDLRRRLGQGDRRRGHDLDLRRAQRLDPAAGPRAAGRRRGRALPGRVRRVHGKRRTPVFGLVASSVLVTALMLMNYTKGLVDAFTFVILLATLTTLVPYAYSAAAQAYLYVTERELFQPRTSCATSSIAALAFAYSVLGDRRLGPGDHRQGLRAAARRHPDLRRDALVAAARGRPHRR